MDRSELLWLDSDVILDWLANRKPWDAAATEIIERAILGDCNLTDYSHSPVHAMTAQDWLLQHPTYLPLPPR